MYLKVNFGVPDENSAFSELSRAFYLRKIFFSTIIGKLRLQLVYPGNVITSSSFMKKRQTFEKRVEKSLIFLQKLLTCFANYLNINAYKYKFNLYEVEA